MSVPAPGYAHALLLCDFLAVHERVATFKTVSRACTAEKRGRACVKLQHSLCVHYIVASHASRLSRVVPRRWSVKLCGPSSLPVVPQCFSARLHQL